MRGFRQRVGICERLMTRRLLPTEKKRGRAQALVHSRPPRSLSVAPRFLPADDKHGEEEAAVKYDPCLLLFILMFLFSILDHLLRV